MWGLRYRRGRKNGEILIPLGWAGLRYLRGEQRGRWKSFFRDAAHGKVSLTRLAGRAVRIQRTFGRVVEIDLDRGVVRKRARGDARGYALLKAQHGLLAARGPAGPLFPAQAVIRDIPGAAVFECSLPYFPIHPAARSRWRRVLPAVVRGALLTHFEETRHWRGDDPGVPGARILGAFVHGDIGSEHLRVNRRGAPVLIDWMYGPAPFMVEALRLESGSASGSAEGAPCWHEVRGVLEGTRSGFSDAFAQGTWAFFRSWAEEKFGSPEAGWIRANLRAACLHVAAHERDLLGNGGERYRLGIMVGEALAPAAPPPVPPAPLPGRWMVLAACTRGPSGYGVLCRSLIGALAKDPELRVDVFTGDRKARGRGRHRLKSEDILRRPRLWRWIAFLDFLVLRLCARGRYDGVLVLVEHYAAAGWMFARLKKIPCVVTQHGTYAVRLPRELPYYRRVWEEAARVVPVSRYTRRRMEEEGLRCNYQVITPGVDRSRFSGSRAAREPVVLFVGNLKDRKGLDFLLDALALAQEKFPPVRLKVIGDIDKACEKFRDVSARIRREGLNVEFTGPVTDQGLAEAYAGARLNALPSRSQPYHFEGFGLVHLEANACGTLTVGTRNSGNEDAVRDEMGHLVEYGDSAALAALILRAMALDPYPSLPVHALKSWEEMAREYKDLLRSLRPGRAGG